MVGRAPKNRDSRNLRGSGGNGGTSSPEQALATVPHSTDETVPTTSLGRDGNYLDLSDIASGQGFDLHFESFIDEILLGDSNVHAHQDVSLPADQTQETFHVDVTPDNETSQQQFTTFPQIPCNGFPQFGIETGNQPLSSQILPFSSHIGFQELHWPHMQALANFITSLDSCVQLPVLSIDEVLQTSKTTLGSLVSIMSLDAYTHCRSCKTLISTALELLVNLYETALEPNPPAQPIYSRMPGLSFGMFEIDPQEQVSICNQLISKELQRILPLVQTLRAGCGAAVGSDRRRQHQRVFLDMESRVHRLVEYKDSDHTVGETAIAVNVMIRI